MSNILQNQSDIYCLKEETINILKQNALTSPNKRSRLCLHHAMSHLTHEMIIVFHEKTIVPVHRHPVSRSESYHVIEGSMKVFFFDEDGYPTNYIILDSYPNSNPIFYRLSSHTWHLPIPTSEFMVYHECLTGPFEKKSDIEYPKWSCRYNSRDKIKSLLMSNVALHTD